MRELLAKRSDGTADQGEDPLLEQVLLEGGPARVEALEYVGRTAEVSDALLNAIAAIRALSDPRDVRLTAGLLRASATSEHEPVLLRLLRCDDPTPAADAARALGRIGTARAVPALTQATTATDPTLATAARVALEALRVRLDARPEGGLSLAPDSASLQGALSPENAADAALSIVDEA